MDKLVDLFTLEGRANRSWYFWHVVLDDFVVVALVLVLLFQPGTVGPNMYGRDPLAVGRSGTLLR